jgi:DivIVA domain-containing protein
MTDTSDSFAPRSSRTTPEAIAERSFSQVKRGYAESEVRAYLRMVSSDFAAAASRERDLTARIRDLEDQLRRPVLPPSDQDLIAALGEETARVLGQARESAIELKNKAEEHARRVVREAQETARELRTTTQQAVETKTREAEDAARNRAKEIVGEARGLRERVLADLEERRQELERQIAELRGGRGKLVETYELVERALGHAARVMAEEPSTPPDIPAADIPAAPSEPASAPDDAPTHFQSSRFIHPP